MRPRSPTGSSSAGPCSKKADTEGYVILYVDEAGFYLLPGVVRTWAPKGQTPILRCKLTRDHLSVISAISAAGALYLQIQAEAFDSQAVIGFLEHLLAEIEGKLLIIWDGASIHRSQAIKNFLAEEAAQRLHLERLPAYAPELNPDEGIWHYLKHVELRNVCCPDLGGLRTTLDQAAKTLAAKPHIIQACFQQVGYY